MQKQKKLPRVSNLKVGSLEKGIFMILKQKKMPRVSNLKVGSLEKGTLMILKKQQKNVAEIYKP